MSTNKKFASNSISREKMNIYILNPMRFDDFGYKTQYYLTICDPKGRTIYSGMQVILKIVCKDNSDNREDVELKNNGIDKKDKIMFSFFLEKGYEKAKMLCSKYDVDFDKMCKEIKCVQHNSSEFEEFWDSYEPEENEKNDQIKCVIDISIFRDMTFKRRILRDYINDDTKNTKNMNFNLFEIEQDGKKISYNFDDSKCFGSKIISITGKNGSRKSILLSMIKTYYIKQSKQEEILDISVSKKSSIPNKILFFQFGLFDKNNAKENSNNEISDFSFHINTCTLDELIDVYNVVTDDDKKKQLLKKYINIFFSDEVIYEPTSDILEKLYEQSSTGQKYIILYLVSLLINIEENSLILIDELEVSQHPQNIFNLINFTSECLELFISKSIIVTHSPYIVQSTPKYLSMIMENGIAKKINFETLGTTYDSIVQKIFNVPIAEKPYITLLRANKRLNKTSFEEASNLSENKFLFQIVTGDDDV